MRSAWPTIPAAKLAFRLRYAISSRGADSAEILSAPRGRCNEMPAWAWLHAAAEDRAAPAYRRPNGDRRLQQRSLRRLTSRKSKEFLMRFPIITVVLFSDVVNGMIDDTATCDARFEP